MNKISITEKDLEKYYSDAIISRGEDYYRNGHVINPIILDNKLYAEVIGSSSKNYEVEIEIKDRIIKGKCNCPYHDKCKHQVAVLYLYINNKDSFVDINEKMETLKALSKEELLEVIKNIFKQNPKSILAIATLTSTSKSDALLKDIDLSVYRRQVSNAFWDFVDYYHIDALIYKLESLHKMAILNKDNGNYENAMALLKALIQESSENYGNTDDSDGTFANFIENCLEDYAECAREDNKIKEMINYYFYLYVEKNDYGLFDNNIKIAIDNAGEEYYDFIEEKIKNAKEFADYDLLYLYDKKGATDKYIQLCKDRISDISFRIKLCEKLREIGNLEESIKYCVEGYNNSNYKFEFANLLAEMYEEQGKYENALHYWNSAFLYRSWDLDLYEKVKELSFKIGNWNAIKNNIIETLENNGKYSALLEIYLKEGEIDNAISLASSEKVYIDEVVKVAKTARNTRQYNAIDLFKKVVNYYLAKSKRKYYGIAAKYCETIKEIYKEINDRDKWKEYIQGIRKENRRRPALIDEFKNL